MLGMNSTAWKAVLGLTLLLGACDESEQGRILQYEKGTYLGQPDTPLTDEKIEDLRRRTTLQGTG